MKAMILAAGFGKRLRPLTQYCPKPLIKIKGKPLIVYHLENLSFAGIHEVVINVSYLAQQIIDYLGNGENWNLKIQYSYEDEPQEVAGGIIKALPLLGEQPFLLVNSDIWTDFPFNQLIHHPLKGLAHLILVDNPPTKLVGDFGIDNGQLNINQYDFTYSGIAVIMPELLRHFELGKRKLAPILRENASLISVEHYSGFWADVGTLDSLQFLENHLTV